MALTQASPKKIYLGSTEVKAVYKGTVKVRPEGWTPGSNTIAYYPLTSSTTVNDQSGNNRNLTNTTSVTFGTYQGVDCANFNGSHFLKLSYAYSGGAVTMQGWGYYVFKNNGNNGAFIRFGPNFGCWVGENSSVSADYHKMGCSPGGTDRYTMSSGWKLITVTYDGTGTVKAYVDGVLFSTKSTSPTTGGGLAIGNGNISSGTDYWKGGISEVIIDGKEWTAQEILDYYNQTKGNYGL